MSSCTGVDEKRRATAQLPRWLDAQMFETMIHNLRVFWRWVAERKTDLTAAILGSRGGARIGYDEAKKCGRQ